MSQPGRLAKINAAVTISLVSVVLCALGVGLWQYFSPPIHDDIPYQYICPAGYDPDIWDMDGEPVASLSDAIYSAANHWRYENGRLANILIIIFAVVPPFVLAAMQGVMAGTFLLLILGIGLGRKALDYSWVCAFLPLAMWKLLPWFDHFCSDDFMINYLWSATLILAFLWVILHPRILSSGSKIIATSMLGLVSGMMHEGYSLPVCVALWLLLIFPKICPGMDDSSHKRIILPCIAFSIGTAVCALAPSTLHRALSDNYTDSRANPVEMLKFFGMYMLPMWIYAAMLLFLAFKQGISFTISKLRGQLFWLIIAAGVCGVLAMLQYTASRVLLLPDAIFLMLALQLLPSAVGDKMRQLKGLAVILVAIQCAFFWQLVRNQQQVGSQIADCAEDFAARGDGRAYVSREMTWHTLPWYTFGLIHDPVNTNAQYYKQLIKTLPKYKGQRGISALILPDSLREVNSFNELPSLGSSNQFRGAFPMVLSREFVPDGTEVPVSYGEPLPSLAPWKRDKVKAGEGILVASECLYVPAFAPDTVYAVFFKDSTGRMYRQRVTFK